jgi:hypothetical protein
MSNISIPAHFDGERILLDEPIELEPNTKLIVTVLGGNDAEHESWLRLSGLGLETAYGTDEEEYSLDSMREANPEYDEGRRRNSHPGSSS